MAEPRDPERRHLERLETLIDVVYALVILQLVLLFPIPSEEEWQSRSLGVFFAENVHVIVNLVIGLALVIIYWGQSNALFGKLVRTDGTHAALSIVQVFCVLIYLVSMSIGTEFDEDPWALGLQSLTLGLAGFSSIAAWTYALKEHRLLRSDCPLEEAFALRRQYLAEPITAAITLPCAFVGAGVWGAAWLSRFLVVWVLKRRAAQRPEAAEP